MWHSKTVGPNVLTANTIYMHERQDLNQSLLQGNASNGSYTLNTANLNMAYWLDNTYGATFGLFDTTGSSDAAVYGNGYSSRTNSPNTSGAIFEVDWNPFARAGAIPRKTYGSACNTPCTTSTLAPERISMAQAPTPVISIPSTSICGRQSKRMPKPPGSAPMQDTSNAIYFAQAFRHGEAEQHSYVIAIGGRAVVEALAKTEHARLRGAYGVAIYRSRPDVATQDNFRLVGYLSSDMGEKWTCSQPDEEQAT